MSIQLVKKDYMRVRVLKPCKQITIMNPSPVFTVKIMMYAVRKRRKKNEKFTD